MEAANLSETLVPVFHGRVCRVAGDVNPGNVSSLAEFVWDLLGSFQNSPES
jgi:hypothetical protein